MALSTRRKGVAQLAEPTGILITACSIEIADPSGVLPSGCPEPRPTVTHRRSSRSGAMEMRHRTLGSGVGYYPECAGLSAVIARHGAERQTAKASPNLRKVFVPGGHVRECVASLLRPRSAPWNRGGGEDTSHSPYPTHRPSLAVRGFRLAFAVCAVAECRCMTAHPARKTALPEGRITVLRG